MKLGVVSLAGGRGLLPFTLPPVLTLEVTLGQSRKTQVIAMGLSKELRLIARSRSYRVQVRGKVNSQLNRIKQWISVQWHDVQVIPRTQKRDDIPFERVTAEAAFRRRESELGFWVADLGVEKVRRVIDGVVGSGMYKGSLAWIAIRSELDREFQPKLNSKDLAFTRRATITGRLSTQFQIDWIALQKLYPRLLEGWNGSGYLPMEVGNELKSGTGKKGDVVKHSSWERYATAQSFGVRQKHHADASLRRIAFQERQEQQNDRLRRLVSRHTDTLRFDWTTVEGRKEIQAASP